MSSTEASPGYMGTTLPQKKKKKKIPEKRKKDRFIALFIIL
jgi:hypothetical protein